MITGPRSLEVAIYDEVLRRKKLDLVRSVICDYPIEMEPGAWYFTWGNPNELPLLILDGIAERSGGFIAQCLNVPSSLAIKIKRGLKKGDTLSFGLWLLVNSRLDEDLLDRFNVPQSVINEFNNLSFWKD